MKQKKKIPHQGESLKLLLVKLKLENSACVCVCAFSNLISPLPPILPFRRRSAVCKIRSSALYNIIHNDDYNTDKHDFTIYLRHAVLASGLHTNKNNTYK